MKDTFEITSGHLVFSDPCYTPPSITVECLNGRYNAWVEKNDEGRIKELSFCSVNYSSMEFLAMPASVSVDLYVDSILDGLNTSILPLSVFNSVDII